MNITNAKYTGEAKGNNEFQVFRRKGGKYVCCCGYTLYKADADLWRCEGGGHNYSLRDGDVIYDKFGNPSFRVAKPKNKKEK